MSLPLSLIIPNPHSGRRARVIDRSAWFGYTVVFLLALVLVRGIRFRLPGVLGFASNITVSDVIALTNQSRQQNNLPPLSVNDALARAAQKKAEHMFANNYWAHVAPDGTEPWYFIEEEGYSYLYAGENLARDFNGSKDVVDAWLASPTHRDNLLSNKYNEIGVAVVNGVLDGFETTLVVQMFGSSASVASSVSDTSSQGAVPAPTAVPTPPPSLAYPAALTGPFLETPKEKTTVSLPPIGSVEESRYPLRLLGRDASSRMVNFSGLVRSSSLIFLFFAGLLFFLDGLVARYRRIRRLSGHTLAHIGLLGIALIALFYTSSGMIL